MSESKAQEFRNQYSSKRVIDICASPGCSNDEEIGLDKNFKSMSINSEENYKNFDFKDDADEEDANSEITETGWQTFSRTKRIKKKTDIAPSGDGIKQSRGNFNSFNRPQNFRRDNDRGPKYRPPPSRQFKQTKIAAPTKPDINIEKEVEDVADDQELRWDNAGDIEGGLKQSSSESGGFYSSDDFGESNERSRKKPVAPKVVSHKPMASIKDVLISSLNQQQQQQHHPSQVAANDDNDSTFTSNYPSNFHQLNNNTTVTSRSLERSSSYKSQQSVESNEVTTNPITTSKPVGDNDLLAKLLPIFGKYSQTHPPSSISLKLLPTNNQPVHFIKSPTLVTNSTKYHFGDVKSSIKLSTNPVSTHSAITTSNTTTTLQQSIDAPIFYPFHNKIMIDNHSVLSGANNNNIYPATNNTNMSMFHLNSNTCLPTAPTIDRREIINRVQSQQEEVAILLGQATPQQHHPQVQLMTNTNMSAMPVTAGNYHFNKNSYITRVSAPLSVSNHLQQQPQQQQQQHHLQHNQPPPHSLAPQIYMHHNTSDAEVQKSYVPKIPYQPAMNVPFSSMK